MNWMYKGEVFNPEDNHNGDFKYCKRCDTKKLVSEFYTSKTQSGGYSSMCKSCDKERKQNKYRTKDGIIASIYRGQKNRRRVQYTQEELRYWMLNQNLFHKLHNEWKLSGYDKNLTPSVDRINPLGVYSFDNIQLMTWIENKNKGYSDRKEGIDTRTGMSVSCYDIHTGVKIATYPSIMIASRELDIKRCNIRNSLRRGHTEGKKRIWKYD